MMNSEQLTEAGEQLYLVMRVIDNIPLDEMVFALDKGVKPDPIISSMIDPTKSTFKVLKRLVRASKKFNESLIKIKKLYGSEQGFLKIF